ncbi:hypothetical protein EBS43_12245 [bacterium]|nr:hypothetical protein [bacterium]
MRGGVSSNMEEESTICYCYGVTRGDLLSAIRGGAQTLTQLQWETLATSGCGGCEVMVQEILDQEKAALRVKGSS